MSVRGFKKTILTIKNYISNQKISRKIVITFFIFLCTSLLFTYIFYNLAARSHSDDQLSRSAEQTLNSIGSNLKEMIGTVNNSYTLLLKLDIASILDSPRTPAQIKIYENSMFNLVDTYTHLSSIYVIGFDNQMYSIDKNGKKQLAIATVEEAPWFNEVMNLKGEYLLSYNAGNIFKEPHTDFISVIRVLNDLETQQPRGIILLNIPISSIDEIFKSVFDSNPIHIVLADENNTPISTLNTMSNTLEQQEIFKLLDNDIVYNDKITHNQLIARLHINPLKWNLVATFPKDDALYRSEALFIMVILILLINTLMMLLSAIFIFRFTSTPVNKLVHSMQGVKDNIFTPVHITYPNSEIGKLQLSYNLMIHEIQSLISRLVEEQKIKRQTELRVMQEQIKPHFLYNTLNAISYMALTNEKEVVYDALETLGSFYRHSLSSGDQIITVKQEIKIVKDYIALLKLRHESLFEAHFDISEDVLEHQIIKLLIQPLVENAIYHGINPKGEKGNVFISISQCGNLLKLIVQDDGVGMAAEIVEKLNSMEEKDSKDGFGLAGTIERLRIFYREKMNFFIESTKGEGTKITLEFPYKSDY